MIAVCIFSFFGRRQSIAPDYGRLQGRGKKTEWKTILPVVGFDQIKGWIMMTLRVTYKFHIGWMYGILGEVDGGQGKPSDVGEEFGELVDGLQIPQHVQSESAKTYPVKGLETRQGLSVHRTHIKTFQWAEDRGIRRRRWKGHPLWWSLITQFLDLYNMILRRLIKRDDHLKAGTKALQDGQAIRSKVGNADREPSQFLDGWMVLQESCTWLVNWRRSSRLERQLQLLEAGEPAFREVMKFKGDFQVLRGREDIRLDTENKVVMLNAPQALAIAQTCG